MQSSKIEAIATDVEGHRARAAMRPRSSLPAWIGLALFAALTEGSKAVGYGCTKNSDMEGAEAAAAGGSGKPRASIIVRSMLSCWYTVADVCW